MAGVSMEKQRAWFKEARDALQSDDLPRFKRIKERLKDYPLMPYLEIWHARKKLEQDDDFNLPTVLNQYAKIPEIMDLRLARIKNLAKRGQWPHVAIALKKSPYSIQQQLPEISMLSLWYTGEKKEALKRLSEHWEKGHDLSDLAKRLHQKWQAQGHPTRDEIWMRIGVFAKRGKWQKVRELEKLLPQQEHKWIRRWQAMQDDSQTGLKQWKLSKRPYHIAEAMIINDGLKRLSRNDAVSAWKSLHRLQRVFEEKQFLKIEQRIALRAAGEHSFIAAKWLAELPKTMQTEKTRAWQIRLQLLYGHWLKALQAMKKLPKSEQGHSRWTYWQARALEALGKKNEAQNLYRFTAAGRGFYSFLSAERLNLPYQLGVSHLDASASQVRKLKRKIAIQRAYEWWQLDEPSKAIREWNLALKGASDETWKAAALLASDWQWHDQVIRAAFQSGEVDALERRFPIAFEAVVAKTSMESGLSQSLIWSIIRQESAFNVKAISRVGAQGLMQLRPSTAREVAHKYKISEGDPDLLNPEVNIRLGALYLRKLTQRFGDNYAIVAAAYNAGPSRVAGWLKRIPFDKADLWIETIPFEETRQYVQQVMAFTVVYDWRQAKAPVGIVAQIQPASNDEG